MLDPTYCQPCTTAVPVIIQGQDKVLQVVLKSQQSGNPVDITSASEIEAIFLNTDGTYTEKKLSTGGISVISGPGGNFQIALSPSDTQAMAVSTGGAFSDIEIHVTIASKVSIVILTGAVNILARRFPTAP